VTFADTWITQKKNLASANVIKNFYAYILVAEKNCLPLPFVTITWKSLNFIAQQIEQE
jgi:hypothetical protein